MSQTFDFTPSERAEGNRDLEARMSRTEGYLYNRFAFAVAGNPRVSLLEVDHTPVTTHSLANLRNHPSRAFESPVTLPGFCGNKSDFHLLERERLSLLSGCNRSQL